MTAHPSISTIARKQVWLALFSLTVMGVILGGLAALVRMPSLMEWFDRKNEESCRQTRQILYHRGWFQADEELWIYNKVPPPDYSKGGVYFLGASYVEFFTKFWELSPQLQSLVHNYGMPAANPKSEYFLLKYLIEQRGILSGGGAKNLVIFGTAYQPSFYPSESIPSPWVNAWERHGVFGCDPITGVYQIPHRRVAQFISLEETFQAACLTRLESLVAQTLNRWRHHGLEPVRVHDPARYIAQRRGEMGPDWQQKITKAVANIGRNIDYLQARHVNVAVVFMPEGTWEDALPYSPEYRRQLTLLCAEKHVPISDWSKLLTDDEFADSAHSNIYGMEKGQAACLNLALPFLRSTGALTDTNGN